MEDDCGYEDIRKQYEEIHDDSHLHKVAEPVSSRHIDECVGWNHSVVVNWEELSTQSIFYRLKIHV